MATQLQIRRGTTSQMSAFTGAEGELAVNTTTDTVHVHDGSTAGGFALAKADGSNIATYAGSFTTIAASGTITGNVTGDVTGDLTGSVLTAAQTNITSVGTLSALTVSGALTVDTDTLVVDATNNRVGIGTSNPDTSLHVQTPSGTKTELNLAQTAVTNYRLSIPASTDALTFVYGANTERMRLDGASGNLLVGSTTSTGSRLSVIDTATASKQIVFSNNSTYYGSVGHNAGTGYNEYRTESGGKHGFYRGTSATPDLTIDSSGKLIVTGTVAGYSGTNITVGSPSQATAGLSILSSTTGYGYLLFGDVIGDATGGYSGQINYNHSLNRMGFVTNNTERLAIHGTGQIEATSSANDDYGFEIKNISSTNPYGLQIELANGTSNTTQALIVAASAGNNKFIVWTNGNAQNVNNSYTGLSDLKLKENIVDSGSQWDDLKAVRVRKYSLKDANLDAPNMLGVIAQELEEAGMSGLVDEHPDKDDENNDLGTVTKSVSYSILYMKAIKALQEAMERIETLEAKVQELENN